MNTLPHEVKHIIFYYILSKPLLTKDIIQILQLSLVCKNFKSLINTDFIQDLLYIKYLKNQIIKNQISIDITIYQIIDILLINKAFIYIDDSFGDYVVLYIKELTNEIVIEGFSECILEIIKIKEYDNSFSYAISVSKEWTPVDLSRSLTYNEACSLRKALKACDY